MSRQRTIDGVVAVEGVGFHAGNPVRARLRPGAVNSGIVFSVGGTDLPARPVHAVATPLATALEVKGVQIRMIEHLMSAINGAAVDNLRIEVEGNELPILDGCGVAWSQALESAGIVEQDAVAQVLHMTEPIEVRYGARWARLEPAAALEIDLTIAFDHDLVRRQRLVVKHSDGMYRRELAWARPFGLARLVPAMHRMGLGLGGSLNNTVVFDDHGPINPGGLRAPDEPVRHKVLDALGDLTVLSPRMNARLIAEQPGRGLIVSVVQAAATRPDSWVMRSTRA